MPKFHVSGPDSISFDADFINKGSGLEGKDHFTVVVCADGTELDSVIYNRTTKDFYGNRELSVEYAYKEAANISVRCLEIDKTFESEDLDILSPQLIRQGENGSFITSSNRFIGHRETFIIIPKGWHVHDTGKYPVEDGYIYLDTNASLLRLPAGCDYEPIILIGVGNLGSAILKYNRWQYTVGKIVGGYDMDKNKEGERFGIKIYHIDDLEATFPKGCKIAILAISENVQETVDRLIKLGIKGIVDFTHSHFMVGEGVEVQTVDVVVAIQELVIKMKSNDTE